MKKETPKQQQTNGKNGGSLQPKPCTQAPLQWCFLSNSLYLLFLLFSNTKPAAKMADNPASGAAMMVWFGGCHKLDNSHKQPLVTTYPHSPCLLPKYLHPLA